MQPHDRVVDCEVESIFAADQIITMDDSAPSNLAGFRTLGGRIVGYVTREDLALAHSSGTRIIDYGTRTLLPGFIDVHAHGEVAIRAAYGTIDCRAPSCRTVADILASLSEGLPARRSKWLVGQGNLFLDRKLADGRLPTREELDKVSRSVPIALRAGGHITVMNSAGLRELGIDRGYAEPSHSLSGKPVVMRGANGHPTGLVKEMDSLLPNMGPEDSVLAEALKDGFHALFTRYGVTTVGEISETTSGLQAMERLAAQERLPVNVRSYIWVPGTASVDDALDWRRALGLSGEFDAFGVRGIKVFSDGGFSAKNAALDTPYEGDPDNFGHIAVEKEYLSSLLLRAATAGLQVAIHANGPRAQRWVCRVVEESGLPKQALRPRIEHAGNYMPDANLAKAWERADIVPVPQPVFLYTFGDFLPDYLGDAGGTGRFPLRTLFDQGWPLTSSSDVWIGSEPQATNPLFSVWCAIARRTFYGAHIDDRESLSVGQALATVTTNAALVLGEEAERGSLTPGKRADFVVLDRDPRRVSTDDLPDISVFDVVINSQSVL